MGRFRVSRPWVAVAVFAASGCARAVSPLFPDAETPLPGVAAARRTIAVATFFASCAIGRNERQGRVFCWGRMNAPGRPGDGMEAVRATPREIEGLTDVVDLTGGSTGFCARRADGTVQCFGCNTFHPTTYTGSCGTPPIAIEPVPEFAGALGVATIDDTLCARRPSGVVDCTGDNSHGALGDGTLEPRDGAVRVVGLRQVAQLVATPSHSAFCTLSTSGVVHCWGPHPRGTVGAPPRLTYAADDAVEIALGYTLCVRSAMGVVRCSSVGDWSSLAIVPGVSDIVEIASGAGATMCARSRTGAVTCWGDSFIGDPMHRPEPHRVPGASDAAELVVGQHHACIRRMNGRVACWGYNGLGAVGSVRAEVFVAEPVDVPGL